jgi:hypothetical protein
MRVRIGGFRQDRLEGGRSTRTHRCLLSSMRFSRLSRSALHSSLDCFPLRGGSRTPSARLSGFGGVVPFSSSALSAASCAVMCGCCVVLLLVGSGVGGGGVAAAKCEAEDANPRPDATRTVAGAEQLWGSDLAALAATDLSMALRVCMVRG